jgi:hypothetical protein
MGHFYEIEMTFTPEQLDHIHMVMRKTGKSFNDVVVALIMLGMEIEKAIKEFEGEEEE